MRPRPEDEIDEKSYIYFQDLMDSLEDLPPTYSSKDLGKLASINLPHTFSSNDLGKLASMEDLPPTYSSKDLGKLASMEDLPPTFSS